LVSLATLHYINHRIEFLVIKTAFQVKGALALAHPLDLLLVDEGRYEAHSDALLQQ
jgi:hypothetical protein